MKLKSKKSALLLSFTSLLLCFAMLVGSTFAWFTDTATTGVNKIQAGNLDVKLEYKNSETEDFVEANENTKVFAEAAKWEPGHVEYVVLKVSNEGNLALKYKLGINIANEVGSTNVYDNPFNLSDYIRFAVLDGDKTEGSVDRDALVAAATDSKFIKEGYTGAETPLYPKVTPAVENQPSEKTVTLVVWMPTTVDNKANHKTGAAAPSVDLGINVVATQLNSESDSFGPDYDENAQYPEIVSDVNSLKEAITAGKASVILAKDVTVEDGKQISVTKDVAIDFNGKTLKGTLESGSISSSDPSNNLVLSDPNNDGSYSIDGHIVHYEDDGMTQIAAIAAWKPTVTVESGRYTHDNAVVLCQIQTSEPATGVVINGGVFDGKGAASVIADVIGDVVINNGTFNAHHSDGGNSGECVYLSSGSRYVPTITTINGGVFNASKRVFFVKANTGYTQKIIVNSGSFNVEQGGQLIEVSSGNASDYLTINGGTFNVDPSDYVAPGHTATDNGNGTWTVQ